MARLGSLVTIMGLGAFVLAGCGTSAPNGAPTQSNVAVAPSSGTTTAATPSATTSASTTSTSATVPPDTKVMTLGSLTLRIPKKWVIGTSSTPGPGSKQLSATSSTDGKVTIHELSPVAGNVFILLPQLPKPSGLTSNPENTSPYFTEYQQTTGSITYATLSDLTTSGTEYMVTMTMPASESKELRTMIHSINAPSPANVSQAVNLLRSKDTGTQSVPLATAQSGSRQWILAGGQPATAQEGWFLFRSQDNGSQWSLTDQTSWKASSPVFPNTVGSPAMLFWNAQDGVIIQPSYGSPALLAYSTSNGGTSWRETTIKYGHQGNVFQAPKLTRGAKGLLTVKVALSANQTLEFTSQDGGSTWTAAH